MDPWAKNEPMGCPRDRRRGLIVAEEMKDLKGKARYQLCELFGEDAFYDHLEDVMKQYRQQFNLPVPPKRSHPTSEGVGRGA